MSTLKRYLLFFFFFFFFFNDTATTEIYTLSLHDALPISNAPALPHHGPFFRRRAEERQIDAVRNDGSRSEEHTSELQSPCNLVCRLLLEKKNIHTIPQPDQDRQATLLL